MNTEMKKILLLLVSFIISGTYITCAQVFKNADLQISQLEEGVWVVETTDMGTMYIVEGNEKALLIDTGTKCDSLDKIIGYITKKPYDVVITHAHRDHAGNIHFFNEIYLHPADTVLLQKSYSGAVNFLKEGDIFDLAINHVLVRVAVNKAEPFGADGDHHLFAPAASFGSVNGF